MKAITVLTDAQLVALWVSIASMQVKRGPYKGCVTIKGAKLGDMVLAEASRRGLRLPIA